MKKCCSSTPPQKNNVDYNNTQYTYKPKYILFVFFVPSKRKNNGDGLVCLTVKIPWGEDEIPDEHVHGGHHAGGVGRHEVLQKTAEGVHDLVASSPVEPEQGIDQLLELVGPKQKQTKKQTPNTRL